VKVFVELDGWEPHRTKVAFQRDRTKQTAIVALEKWYPLRFTWSDVNDRAAETAERTYAAISGPTRPSGRPGAAAR